MAWLIERRDDYLYHYKGDEVGGAWEMIDVCHGSQEDALALLGKYAGNEYIVGRYWDGGDGWSTFDEKFEYRLTWRNWLTEVCFGY